jgi:hypothetical protein
MAITTDSLIDFFGTQDTITAGGGTSAVTDGSYSAAADTVTWTNDDDAPAAVFVLKFQYPSGTIDQNGIHLFMQLHNIDSTNDEAQPDANYESHYVGSFPTDAGLAATTDVYVSLGHTVELPNMYTSQVYEFYIKNDCGVTMTAGWTLKVTPVTKGPHA